MAVSLDSFSPLGNIPLNVTSPLFNAGWNLTSTDGGALVQ
jgi:hypothetical protein